MRLLRWSIVDRYSRLSCLDRGICDGVLARTVSTRVWLRQDPLPIKRFGARIRARHEYNFGLQTYGREQTAHSRGLGAFSKARESHRTKSHKRGVASNEKPHTGIRIERNGKGSPDSSIIPHSDYAPDFDRRPSCPSGHEHTGRFPSCEPRRRPH